MPGIKLLTKHDARTCLKFAWRTAQDLGYSLSPLDDSAKSFTATKGNAIVGLLTGPLAPYCHFQVSVESYSDRNELVIEMNTPWFTSGAVGVGRVRGRAEEMLSATASAIERDGGTILEKREF